MSNGNWVNEVGNQGMMFLFCSTRKKKIGNLFFYGGKPHCQNSGQAVGRRESLYEFSSRPTELKYVCAASWGVLDQPGDTPLFNKPPGPGFLYKGSAIWVRISKKLPGELYAQVTRIH